MATWISRIFIDWMPRRALLFLFVLFACMFSYVIRVLSVGIIYTEKNNDSLYDIDDSKNHEKYVIWGDEQIIAAIAFSFGAMLSSIPAGIISEKYGGSKVVSASILTTAILNLLVPWYTALSYIIVILLRFIAGSCVGAIYPALNAIIARWSPPEEKGIFMWAIQSGSFGACATFFFYTYVTSDYGWKIMCWSTSCMMLVFYWLWVHLIYDSPEIHPSITSIEIEFIKRTIASSVSNKKQKFPVKSVISSLPFIVLMYAYLANTWGTSFVPTSLEYRWKISNSSPKTLGTLNVLLHIPVLLIGLTFAIVGDFWRGKKLLKLGAIRRIFIILSHFAPTVCLLLITPYTNCDQLPNLPMMVLIMFFNSAACQSSLQNHHDLAPNYAGYLYGIMSAVSSFFDIIILTVVSGLTSDPSGVQEWCSIMQILALTYLSSMLLFWIWGSSKIQIWNNPNYPRMADANFTKESGCELGHYNSIYCIEEK